MKKLVVLSGSGISAESGLSTFRGGNGLWDHCRVEDVCTYEAWRRNPQYVLDFYNTRRKDLEKAKPNMAHKLLADLEHLVDESGKPLYRVVVLTQNVDNLHERAGSSKVIHLHGELTKVRPENTYNDADFFSERYVIDIGYGEINIGDKAANAHQLRPHIVWFGEAVPKLEDAVREISDADVVLIVGTSLQVYPAAGLYRYAPGDATIYVIDPEDVPICSSAEIVHIKDIATEGMKKFTQYLR